MIKNDIIEKIFSAVRENDELPEHVTSSIYEVLHRTEELEAKEPALKQLLEQISDYDPHGDVGCFGGGTSLAAILNTVKRLL